MKFEKDDIIQCTDTRNVKHLQWNKVYKVLWCSEHYVRLSMSPIRVGGGLQATMFSVDRFEKAI